jgi:signal transduction histidine kinase
VKRLSIRLAVVLAFEFAVSALAVLHSLRLGEIGTLPFDVDDVNGRIVVTAGANRDVRQGDHIESIDGTSVPFADALELLGKMHGAGERVELGIERDGMQQRVPVTLVPAYDSTYSAVAISVGLATIALAFFVLAARPSDRTAAYLHTSLFSMGVVVMFAAETPLPGEFLGQWLSAAYFLAYIGVGAFFLLFTLRFPRPVAALSLWAEAAIALPGFAVSAMTARFFMRSIAGVSIDSVVVYHDWNDWFHIVILAYVLLGVLAVIKSYRNAGSASERTKLRWVAWAFVVGPSPILFLRVIPMLFRPDGLVPEIAVIPFLILIPAALAISFIRHKLLDIDLVIRRTTSYTIVLLLTSGLYLAVLGVIAALVGNLTASVSSAFLVALLFEPIRRRVQGLVDRLFFRTVYDYRTAQRRLVDEIKGCLDIPDLGRILSRGIGEVMHVEWCDLYVRSEDGTAFTIVGNASRNQPVRVSLKQDALPRHPASWVAFATPSSIEPETGFRPIADALEEQAPITVMIPMGDEGGAVVGILCAGSLRSGQRYTEQDIDFLSVLSVHAGLELQRIGLLRRLFLQETESRRLAELNRLKSDFVSYVSHELRAPLTSIKMFGELLRKPARNIDAKGREFVSIIESEADRLSRMVNTILNSSRIDEGRISYAMQDADLNGIVRRSLETMRIQLTMSGFTVKHRGLRAALPIRGDPDALADAVMNIISNAVKYSADDKFLDIHTRVEGAVAVCSIRDRGIGISERALPHIFEKNYRDPVVEGRIDGLGLGLPLVKHVVESHQGTISALSVSGSGSEFTIRIPLRSVRSSKRRSPHTQPSGKDTDDAKNSDRR